MLTVNDLETLQNFGSFIFKHATLEVSVKESIDFTHMLTEYNKVTKKIYDILNVPPAPPAVAAAPSEPPTPTAPEHPAAPTPIKTRSKSR